MQQPQTCYPPAAPRSCRFYRYHDHAPCFLVLLYRRLLLLLLVRLSRTHLHGSKSRSRDLHDRPFLLAHLCLRHLLCRLSHECLVPHENSSRPSSPCRAPALPSPSRPRPAFAAALPWVRASVTQHAMEAMEWAQEVRVAVVEWQLNYEERHAMQLPSPYRPSLLGDGVERWWLARPPSSSRPSCWRACQGGPEA